MSKRFKLYNVNIKYIRNLHNVDDNVPSVTTINFLHKPVYPWYNRAADKLVVCFERNKKR